MTTMTEKLPAWFAGTTMGQKLLAEEDAKAFAKREQAVAECAAADAAFSETMPALLKKFRAAQAATAKAEATAAKVKLAQGEAYGEMHNARCRHEGVVGALKHDLLATADPLINEFLAELHALTETTRRMRPQLQFERMYNSVTLRGTEVATHWTRPSILKRLEAIRCAVQLAEGLKLQAVDVAVEIDKIRLTIPDGLALVALED